MGKVFDEVPEASRFCFFLDKVQEPYRITACPTNAHTVKFKEVTFKDTNQIGFVIDGPPNPPFSISTGEGNLTGDFGTLRITYLRPVEQMGEWQIRAKRLKPKKSGAANQEFEPGDLDVLTVVVLPALTMGVDIKIVRNKAEPPWTKMKLEDFRFLIEGASDILQKQLNVRFELGQLTEYFHSAVHSGVLPRYRSADNLVTHPLIYHRTGINWDGMDLGCFAFSTPMLDGCRQDESVMIKDPKSRAFVDGENFINSLMLDRNTNDIDLFYVSDFQVDVVDKNLAAFNPGATRKCVIKRSVDPIVVAHEVGHWIFRRVPTNVKDHSIVSDNLMFPDKGGKRLDMEQIYYGHFEVSNYLRFGWRFG